MKYEDYVKENKKIEIGEIIYRINKTKTYDDYVMVYLDDDKIMIPIESYCKYNLSSLNGLDHNLYTIFKKQENEIKAYRSCLRKLSGKDYTIYQINKHLDKYDIDKTVKKDIVDILCSYGLLDDEKYCISKSNYYDNNDISFRQIRQKLLKDGIDKDLIEKNLSYDDSRELSKAIKIASKCDRSITNKPVRAKKQSILNRLHTYGFDLETAKKALESISVISENEDYILSKEYDKALNKYSKKYCDYELKQRIYASLLRKGFDLEDIKRIVEV